MESQMTLKDAMQKLREGNLSGESRYFALAWGVETDEENLFGDGIVLKINENFPVFVKQVAGFLKENGLGNTELDCSYKIFDFTPVNFGEKLKDFANADALVEMDKDTYESAINDDYDIARLREDAVINPRLNCLVIKLDCKDSYDSVEHYISFSEMENAMKETAAEAPKGPGM